MKSYKHLNESLRTAKQKYSELISIEDFNELISYDISKSFKYIEKICELYLKHINKSTIKNLIKDYDLYVDFMDNKDITNKSYNQIVADINIAKIDADNTKKKQKQKEEERNLLATINNVKIYQINDFYDAYKKGKGSHWCTSLSNMWFDNHYNKGERLLILHNKNVSFDNPFSLICILFDINTKLYSIYDKNNKEYLEDINNIDEIYNNLGYPVIEYIENYIKNF